jgi:hypothetical protein
MDYVDDDRVPITEILEKFKPEDLVHTDERKTIHFDSPLPISKTTDPQIIIHNHKKRLTF